MLFTLVIALWAVDWLLHSPCLQVSHSQGGRQAHKQTIILAENYNNRHLLIYLLPIERPIV